MVAGLIGCGRMGMCMLQKMVEKGFEVVIYDKSGEACDRAKAAGAHVAENPAEVGAGEGREAVLHRDAGSQHRGTGNDYKKCRENKGDRSRISGLSCFRKTFCGRKLDSPCRRKSGGH